MRGLWAVVLLAVLAASLAVFALRDSLAGWIGVKGRVHVDEGIWMEPRSIEVSLDINSSRGSAEFRDVAVLHVPGERGRVLFRVFDVGFRGNVSIALSGQVVLEGPEKHVVDMPCMAYTGQCIRVLVLIPGYDAPLSLSGGSYRVSLRVSWRDAGGHGEVSFKIGVLDMSTDTGGLELVSTGRAPENATQWAWAEASTRSYALLVEETRVEAGSRGYGSLGAWAWLFSPRDNGTMTFTFTLVRLGEAHETIARLAVPVEWSKPYYQAVVKVWAKPGRYVLRVSMDGLTLESPVITIEP